MNLLGVKYLVHKVADGHAPWAFPFWTYPAGTFPTIYSDGVYQVFENKDAFPRAFLVNNYAVESGPQEILDTMFGPKFDLRNSVVLEQDPKLKLGGQGTVNVTSYAPDKISIATNSTGNNLLFLSDSYYPGWQAYVDGKSAPIYRADFSFRAVLVPKGKHSVEFIYQPLSFTMGVFAAVVSLMIMLIPGLVGKRRFTSFPKT
jgi:hypothetical protein